ncbi:MAG: YbgC/YbaW family acyl-CoA thioester hydrolase [Myxococcota bacterium]|jgi:YbgC/YbaW family acyl-CoA thioester hydrolase
MGFEHHLTARFYEIDRAGIVFYGRFYEYAHAALEELLAEIFGRADAIFESLGFGMPLVHSEADYFAPTRMGDKLKITVEIERLGTKSVTFAYHIASEAGQKRATVKLVHCFVQMETFTSIPAPDVFLDGLRRLDLI